VQSCAATGSGPRRFPPNPTTTRAQLFHSGPRTPPAVRHPWAPARLPGGWLCPAGWPRATQELKGIPGIWAALSRPPRKTRTEGTRARTPGAVGDVNMAFIQLPPNSSSGPRV